MERFGPCQGCADYPCDGLSCSDRQAEGVELFDDLEALAFPLRNRSTQKGSGKIVAKETTISFKCDDDFADWLRKESFDLDKSASELIRACLLLGMPQVKALRGLDRVCLEDIRR
jgi:hypothetical protein